MFLNQQIRGGTSDEFDRVIPVHRLGVAEPYLTETPTTESPDQAVAVEQLVGFRTLAIHLNRAFNIRLPRATGNIDEGERTRVHRRIR